MLENNPDYQCGILGCVGKDDYGKTIVSELEKVKVDTSLVQIHETELSSRCGCGIYLKERCLMPQIRASSKLCKNFVEKNIEKILQADILFVEGYFLIECWEIVQFLMGKFKEAKKKIAFTLSATFMVEFHFDKIKQLADNADLIFCNEDEAASFVKMLKKEPASDEENAKTIHAGLPASDRLLIVTCGKNPVITSTYCYTKNDFKFKHTQQISVIPDEEIVDTNGCGDAFVGGFMSQYLKDNTNIEGSVKEGVYASSVILKHIGCTYPEKPKK